MHNTALYVIQYTENTLTIYTYLTELEGDNYWEHFL